MEKKYINSHNGAVTSMTDFAFGLLPNSMVEKLTPFTETLAKPDVLKDVVKVNEGVVSPPISAAKPKIKPTKPKTSK